MGSLRGGLTGEKAERVGFEPTLRYNRRPLFESGTINHSDTSPVLFLKLI